MRPGWEGEGTRPEGSESEEALELHDEKMAGYQMRPRGSKLQFGGKNMVGNLVN